MRRGWLNSEPIQGQDEKSGRDGNYNKKWKMKKVPRQREMGGLRGQVSWQLSLAKYLSIYMKHFNVPLF